MKEIERDVVRAANENLTDLFIKRRQTYFVIDSLQDKIQKLQSNIESINAAIAGQQETIRINGK